MTLLERLRTLPCVEEVSVEPSDGGTCYFTYLKPGWEWSEQRGFGTETVREAYSLAKAATFVGMLKNFTPTKNSS